MANVEELLLLVGIHVNIIRPATDNERHEFGLETHETSGILADVFVEDGTPGSYSTTATRSRLPQTAASLHRPKQTRKP